MVAAVAYVLGVSRYRITTDQSTGEVRAASKVFYIQPGQKVAQSDKVGIFPVEASGSYELFEQFHSLPGKYNIDFSLVPRAKGVDIVINSVELIGDSQLNYEEHFQAV